MIARTTLCFALLAAFLLSGRSYAQSCDAYYAFDGNLADGGRNGYHGQMIGKEGAPAEPRFVEGRSGQALKLDGSAAMRAFADLNYDRCPRLTISAWVKVEPAPSQTILGTGGGHRLFASGANLNIRTAGQDLWARDAVHANGGWMFVAAVWDHGSGTHRLYWRGRHVEGAIGDSTRQPEPAIWLGADNDKLHYPAKDLVIDELRITGNALDADQIMALRDAAPGGSSGQFALMGATGVECTSPGGCPDGSYCAMDGTCHPDSHRPMQGEGGGTTLQDLQASSAERNADIAGAVDYESPTDLLRNPGSGEDGGTGQSTRLSPETEQAIADRVAESRPPEIGYDSEEEALAAAERRKQERLEETQEATSAPQTTIPHPVGEKRYSGVSGTRGDIIREIELFLPYMEVFDKAWLTGIGWKENRDRPCRVFLEGLRPIEYPGARLHEEWDADERLIGCDGGDWIFTQVPGYVALNQGSPSPQAGGDASAIGQIQVCQNDRDNRRMKGLRINGTRIRSNGTLTVEGNADSTEFPNCRSWAPAVICPSGTLGTGLVIHATEASGDNQQIVGLQLICREVSVTR